MGKLKDLTGMKFGDWEVINIDKSKGKYSYRWLCKCVNCGNIKSIESGSLKNGKSLKCDKCNKKYGLKDNILGYEEDLTGKKFGHFVVNSFAYSKNSHSCWNVECECGNKEIKSISYLRKSKYLMCDECMKRTLPRILAKKEKTYIPFEEIAYQSKENRYEIKGNICIINNKLIIDKEDLETILSFKRYVGINSSGYAYMNWRGKEFFIHRLVMNLPQDYDNETKIIADHIDGNRLDCRKENLRVCHKAYNPINCKLYKNNTSGVKGVVWMKRLSKWQASIQVDKKPIYLGIYEDFEEAVKVRKDAEDKYFGEFKRSEVDLLNE